MKDILNLENVDILRRSNHPPHFTLEDRFLKPSAFIPFCGFGGNAEDLGFHYPNFSIPFCSSFEPITLNDEVCYEIDIRERFPKIKEEDLKLGLLLLIDFNEDKQFHSMREHEDLFKDNNIFKNLASQADGAQMKIYIKTIGCSYKLLISTFHLTLLQSH